MIFYYNTFYNFVKVTSMTCVMKQGKDEQCYWKKIRHVFIYDLNLKRFLL